MNGFARRSALLLFSSLPLSEAAVLRVGGPIQQSGKFASYGNNVIKVFEIFQDWIASSSLDTTITLDFRDATDPATAVTIAQSMATNDEVDIMVIPYTTTMSKPVVEALAAFTKPILVWGGSSSSIFTQATRAPNAFGFMTPAGKYMETGLQSLYSLGARTVAFYKNEDDAFSTSVCVGAETFATGLGYTVAGTISKDGTGVATQLEAWSDISAHVLVGCGLPDDMKELVVSLASSDFTPKAVLATQVSTSTFRAAMTGKEGLLTDLMMPTQWANSGALKDDVVGWTPSDFVSAFSERTGNAPTYHSASAGGACVALANAISAAGGSGDLAAVTTAMKALDITTFYGNIKFSSIGEMEGKGMFTLQNSELGLTTDVVAPSDVAVRDPKMLLNTLRVGGPIQKSGTYAAIGSNAEKAFVVWKDWVNAAELGYDIQLDFRDATTVDEAVKIAQEMVNLKQVDIVVAPYTTGMSKPVVGALNYTNRPVMVWGGSSSIIFTQDPRAPNVFGTLTGAEQYMDTGLELLYDQGAKTALFVQNQKTFSAAVCDGARAKAEALGFEELGAVSIANDGSDIAAVLGNLSLSSDPDVLVGCGHQADIQGLIEYLPDDKLTPKAILSTQVSTGAFKAALETVGNSALGCGLLMPTQWANTGKDDKDPVTEMTASDFASAFSKLTGSAPTYHSASAGAVGVVLSNAIAAAGGASDVNKIVVELKALDVESFYGKLKFGEDGRMEGKGMMTVQNQPDDTVKVVAPEEYKEVEVNYPDTCPAAVLEGDGGLPTWALVLIIILSVFTFVMVTVGALFVMRITKLRKEIAKLKAAGVAVRPPSFRESTRVALGLTDSKRVSQSLMEQPQKIAVAPKVVGTADDNNRERTGIKI